MARMIRRGAAIFVLPLVMVTLVGAQGERGTAHAADQDTGSQSSGGEIVGYHPISNATLESALPQIGGNDAASGQPLGTIQASGMAGDASGASSAGGQMPPAYQTGILGDGPYTLGRDDVIQISVRSQPEFSGSFAVGFDGKIQYSYVGDVPVAGLTKFEVQQVIEQLISRYVRAPIVNVMITAYNSKVVYVIGEVNKPGKFIMRGDAIKLREAVLAAGLPTRDAALARVHVVKPDLTHPEVRIINMNRILFKGRLKEDVNLYPSEIVVVPSTALSSVNRFLGNLLSPVTRMASVAALAAL